MDPTAWLAVVNETSWRELEAANLTFTAFPKHRAKAVQQIRPGDKLVFYVSRKSVFVATAEVSAPAQATNTRVGLVPFALRLALRSEQMVDVENGVAIRQIVPQLTLITNKRNWAAKLQTSLTPLPWVDYELIRSLIDEKSEAVG